MKTVIKTMADDFLSDELSDVDRILDIKNKLVDMSISHKH
jgi:hypothetical protein